MFQPIGYKTLSGDGHGQVFGNGNGTGYGSHGQYGSLNGSGFGCGDVYGASNGDGYGWGRSGAEYHVGYGVNTITKNARRRRE